MRKNNESNVANTDGRVCGSAVDLFKNMVKKSVFLQQTPDQTSALVAISMVRTRLESAHHGIVNLVGNASVSENHRLRLEAIDEQLADLAADVDKIKDNLLVDPLDQ